jgi:hypothetical protein
MGFGRRTTIFGSAAQSVMDSGLLETTFIDLESHCKKLAKGANPRY